MSGQALPPGPGTLHHLGQLDQFPAVRQHIGAAGKTRIRRFAGFVAVGLSTDYDITHDYVLDATGNTGQDDDLGLVLPDGPLCRQRDFVVSGACFPKYDAVLLMPPPKCPNRIVLAFLLLFPGMLQMSSDGVVLGRDRA